MDASDVRLRSGESVAVEAVDGPDEAWAARIEGFLGHKPPLWTWQCAALLRESTGVDARFTVLHRDGVPFAHVLIATIAGVGLLGHVFTRTEDRRKGAARALLERALGDFRDRGGRALYLHTRYDGPPFRLYRQLGFEPVEPESGVMALHVEDAAAFERAWFAPGPVDVEPPRWPQWPASVPLFTAETPDVVRCAGRGLVGRALTEAPWLLMLQEAARAPACVLVQQHTGAVVGLAHAMPDCAWPGVCTVDLHAHPAFVEHAAALLASLPLPEASRYVAYADTGGDWKESALRRAGFDRTAVLPRWVAADAAGSRWIDVGVWRRG